MTRYNSGLSAIEVIALALHAALQVGTSPSIRQPASAGEALDTPLAAGRFELQSLSRANCSSLSRAHGSSLSRASRAPTKQMSMPSAPAMASSSLDLERLMGDLIPKLTPTKRRELRYLVSGLKTRKEIGGIPSVSAALVARAPALVGAHLWRACVEKQRREPEPRPAFLNEVPDDVFKIIARFAAAAKATRDAPDGLRPLFLSHRRGRNVIDWCVALHDVADVIRPDLVNGDRPRGLPVGMLEGYRQHWPRRVLMRAYFHLSRARLLWDGAPRPKSAICVVLNNLKCSRLS